MTYNKPWLRQNMQEVFTPRTLFEHKKTIVEEFRKILGPLELSIDSADGLKPVDAKAGQSTIMGKTVADDDDGDETPLDTEEREAM